MQRSFRRFKLLEWNKNIILGGITMSFKCCKKGREGFLKAAYVILNV